MVDPQKFIDIDRIFKQKNPKLYKWIPSFVMRYVKKIARQNQINAFQNRAKDKFEFDYLDAALQEIGVKITYSGIEHIPIHESTILFANHPLGGADGMAIMQVVGKVRKDIVFIVNDLLSNLKNFGRLFFGINKVGNSTTQQLKQIDDLYQQQNAVIIFPAGLVSRISNNRVYDLEWSKSFVAKAKKHHKILIPVFIEGKLSSFFYKVYKLRKWLKIKANVEMFYLINEMYKQNGQTIHLKFGKPIKPEVLNNSYTDKQWSILLKEYVYFLKDNDASFEDFLNTQTTKNT